ncbi:hypothetical protein HI914_03170 [Erysiphe necator]|nr:hypothetical protein HI914_03170 [Erysiphe necator]
MEDIDPALGEVRNDIKVIKDSSIKTPSILPTSNVTPPENNDQNSNKLFLEGGVGKTSAIDKSTKSVRNTPTESKEQIDIKQKLKTVAKRKNVKSKREAEKFYILAQKVLSPKAIPIALENSPSKFDKILEQEPRGKSLVKIPDSRMKSNLTISDQTKINKVVYDKPPNLIPNSNKPLMVQPLLIDNNAHTKIDKLLIPQGAKRKRSDYDDIENYRQTKILKAMLAIIDLMEQTDDTKDDNTFLSENLVSTAPVCEDIPNPKL